MRTPISSISLIGRNTSGVRIMNIDTEAGVYVASIAKTRGGDSESSEDEDIEDTEEEITAGEAEDQDE